MLKSLKKRSYRFVVVLLLLTTLLTFDVGRVTKVDAAAIAIAVAGGALLATGAVYVGYLALTNGKVYMPYGTGSNVQQYLTDLGRKAMEYGTFLGLYSKVYNFLSRNGVNTLYDYDVTLSRDDLIDAYNSAKDINIIQEQAKFYVPADTPMSTNGFNYDYDVLYANEYVYAGGQFNTLESLGGVLFTGSRAIVQRWLTPDQSTYAYYTVFLEDGIYRNLYTVNNNYVVEKYVNGTWTRNISLYYGGSCTYNNRSYYLSVYPDNANFCYQLSNTIPTISVTNTYPILPDEVIHDEATDRDLPMVEVSPDHYQLNPNWNDDSDPEPQFPIVPYVQLPSQNNWGFNLGDLLDKLEELGQNALTAGILGELINQFKNSLTGSPSYDEYSFYNNGDTYYIDYYSNTYNEFGDTVYNIDVSEQENIIPVDLNTIQRYTNNQYLTVIKERAETFGETFGELVAFWHNCDSEIIYAFLGASIIVLLGAFIGKWGHS